MKVYRIVLAAVVDGDEDSEADRMVLDYETLVTFPDEDSMRISFPAALVLVKELFVRIAKTQAALHGKSVH